MDTTTRRACDCANSFNITACVPFVFGVSARRGCDYDNSIHYAQLLYESPSPAQMQSLRCNGETEFSHGEIEFAFIKRSFAAGIRITFIFI